MGKPKIYWETYLYLGAIYIYSVSLKRSTNFRFFLAKVIDQTPRKYNSFKVVTFFLHQLSFYDTETDVSPLKSDSHLPPKNVLFASLKAL